MDDLVEKLRTTANYGRGSAMTAALHRAADEIERLQAVASKCLLGESGGDCYAAEVVTLRAEIERLRHALRDCSACCGIPDQGDALRAVIKTAADALAAKEG